MDIVIRNLEEFNKYIRVFQKKQYDNLSEDGKVDKNVFRGQADKNWRYIPKLFRKKGWFDNEALMREEITQKNAEQFVDLDPFKIIAKMQHYGAPTRLLDFTFNPLIALYFACSDDAQKNKDGSVALCRISMFKEEELPLEIFLQKAFINRQTTLMKVNADNLQPFFQSAGVVGVIPEANNDRIKNQEGCFALFTYSGEYAEVFNPIEGNDCIKEKMIIPSECKQNILNELEQYYDINEAFVYPELEYQIKAICKKY